MSDFKSILCPVDFSAVSEKIIATTSSMAKKFNAKVKLLHVVQLPETYGGYVVLPPSLGDAVEKARESVLLDLENLKKEYFEGVDVELEVVSGYPPEVILDTITKFNADLLVLGTHGRKGLDLFLFGSVAERVLKSTKITVMTVRPE